MRGTGPKVRLISNPPRAAPFVAENQAKIMKIGERLGCFQKRDDVPPDLRHARYGRYLIFCIEQDCEV